MDRIHLQWIDTTERIYRMFLSAGSSKNAIFSFISTRVNWQLRSDVKQQMLTTVLIIFNLNVYDLALKLLSFMNFFYFHAIDIVNARGSLALRLRFKSISTLLREKNRHHVKTYAIPIYSLNWRLQSPSSSLFSYILWISLPKKPLSLSSATQKIFKKKYKGKARQRISRTFIT